MEAKQLIERYRLQPHPEGGWYREVHRSAHQVVRDDGQHRAGLTVIRFLLEGGSASRWHRVIGADETWHFAAGDPLELLLLPPDGGICRTRLGPEEALRVVPAGWWQAARCLGAWSLVSCCVGPGFDFADFSLMRDLPAAEKPPGVLDALL